jgi:hypothetical protein
MSLRTFSMPCLSMILMPRVVTRRRTKRLTLSNQKRLCCKLGRKRLLVLLLAWETLFPTIGPLPVIGHFLAIIVLSILSFSLKWHARVQFIPESVGEGNIDS